MRASRFAAVATTLMLGIALAPPGAEAATGWRQLSGYAAGSSYPGLGNVDEPTVARLGAGAQVIWPEQTTTSSQAYRTVVLAPTGAIARGVTPVVTDWTTLVGSPRLISVGGQQFLSFSGLRSTDVSQPYTTGAAYYATSPDGVTWTVGAGSMSASTSAYAEYGMDAIDVDGTPVWAANAGSTAGVSWHAGIAPTEPAPAGSDGSLQVGGCCAYDAALARDTATGAVLAAFYSNSDDAAEQGIQVGQILPTPGSLARAPASVVSFNGRTSSVSPDQRIAMVSRPGGGVLVAYKSGYPTTRSVKVWQVGAPKPLTIPGSADARRVAMAAGPDGTVWVVWTTGTAVKAARIKGGRVVHRSTVTLARPARTTDLWHVAASSGAARRVDIVLTATGPGGTIQAYARQARY